jgi:hypothetical protein
MRKRGVDFLHATESVDPLLRDSTGTADRRRRPVAVGTDILQSALADAFDAVRYAQGGLVDPPVVATLLLGSTLIARIGVGATPLDDILASSRRCWSAGQSSSRRPVGSGPAPATWCRRLVS